MKAPHGRDPPSTTAPTKRRRSPVPRALVAAALLSAVLVTALVVVTQLPKWTCDPPGHLWLEAPDRCITLP